MLMTNFRKLIADESGATAIEYGLIAALVSVAAIAALSAMGDSLIDIFSNVCEKLVEAVEGGGGASTANCPTPAAAP